MARWVALEKSLEKKKHFDRVESNEFWFWTAIMKRFTRRSKATDIKFILVRQGGLVRTIFILRAKNVVGKGKREGGVQISISISSIGGKTCHNHRERFSIKSTMCFECCVCGVSRDPFLCMTAYH